MKDSDFVDWNEKMFKKYTNERLYHHPNPIIRYTEDKRVKSIIDMVSIEDKDKILDIGCGEGYITEKISNGDITGIDISETALLMARDKLKDKKNINLLRGRAEKMPFRDNTFNKIICTEVIEHVQSPENVIKEIVPLLKKDGKIIITIPNENLINNVKRFLLRIGLFNLLLQDIPCDMNKEWHLHIFSLDRLKKLINDDLDIIETRAVPFSIFPIRYIVSCSKKDNK